MKKALLISLLFAGMASFAQNLNSYKYVVIPERFSLQREAGEYNLNSLTKMMFEKYGFTVVDEKNLPDDIALNRCKGMYADLLKESGMFKTAVFITLKDCKGNVLFTSEKGDSKEKEYQKAYYEALRKASQSVAGLTYNYAGDDKNTVTITTPVTKTETVTVYVPSAQPEVQQVVNKNTLFAQPIANGYQLVDTTPKVVLKIYKTSQPDSFTAVGDARNGVVFKKGNDWYFEYYKDDKLISEKLTIKF